MKSELQRKGGFTLLEVMIAMALFFSAVTFFSMAYLNTIGAMKSVRVNQGLEQDLAAIRRQALLISDPEEVEKGGTVVTGEHGITRWDIEYEPTNIADLFRVTLSMELDPEDEETGVTEAVEEFYLMRPTWSDPLARDDLRSRSRDRFLEKQMNANR